MPTPSFDRLQPRPITPEERERLDQQRVKFDTMILSWNHNIDRTTELGDKALKLVNFVPSMD